MVGIIGLKGERYRETPSIEVEGIEGYKLVGLNIDVNGKWGGHKAVVAHFTKDGKADPPNELTFLYILVGDYWKVGRWPDDDSDIPTVWETAKLFIQALEANVNRSDLYDVIKKEIGMWIYIKSEPNLWTVGFYSPDGEWHPDNDYSSPEEAAARVHYLNGGTSERTTD